MTQGVEAGLVPVTPLKRLVKPHRGAIKAGPFGSDLTSHDMQGGVVKVYNQRNVIERNFNVGENYVSEDKFLQLRSFEVLPGDVLITTRGTIGRSLVAPDGAQKGILHPCLIRVQPDEAKLNTRYLAWVLQDDEFMQEQVKLLSKSSTIDVIYSETIASLRVPCPPLPAQTAIADFLDRKTTAIDALIAKKEELIQELDAYRQARRLLRGRGGLLQELDAYRQALITETVSKGLNPEVAVRQSGVTGLGEIPAHWHVVKTGKVLRYIKGKVAPKEDLALEGGSSRRFWRTGDFWNLNNREKDEVFVTDSTGLVWKNEGELVICFNGFNSEVGKGTVGMARFEGEGHIDSMLALIRPKAGQHRKYIEYVHCSAFLEAAIVAARRGTTAMHAGYAQYGLQIPLPPLPEQEEIAAHLDARLAGVNRPREIASKQIAMLKEYRASLMSGAVIGKLTIPTP